MRRVVGLFGTDSGEAAGIEVTRRRTELLAIEEVGASVGGRSTGDSDDNTFGEWDMIGESRVNLLSVFGDLINCEVQLFTFSNKCFISKCKNYEISVISFGPLINNLNNQKLSFLNKNE